MNIMAIDMDEKSEMKREAQEKVLLIVTYY